MAAVRRTSATARANQRAAQRFLQARAELVAEATVRREELDAAAEVWEQARDAYGEALAACRDAGWRPDELEQLNLPLVDGRRPDRARRPARPPVAGGGSVTDTDVTDRTAMAGAAVQPDHIPTQPAGTSQR